MPRPASSLYLTLVFGPNITMCMWGPPVGVTRGAGVTQCSHASPQISPGCSESHTVHRMQDFDGQVVQVRDGG